MAAIFQIRRGTSDISSSILDGELYLHKGKNSLQVSIGDGNPITLLALNTSSVGNINLTGNLTASNAYFSGDVAISGNLFLGNNSSDNISALGVFTSDLSAGTTNVYNIGSTTSVWKNVYATSFSGSFSGSINGVNEGIATFSASVDNRLDQLQLASASLQSFSSSQEAKNIIIGAYTSSMNSFSSSQLAKDVIIGAYTSSMNTFTSSVNGHISDINTYTASLKTAIDVTGGNTRIIGNLIVDGTQTSLNVNNVYVEDKLITVSSGSTSSAISDGAGFEVAGANVSMSWEHTNTRFGINTNVGVIGSISSSTIVGLNNASVNVYSTSVDSRLSNLQSTSASVSSSLTQINSFTASNGNTSLNAYTTSIDAKFTTLQSLTASNSASINQLNSVTASLQLYTSSANVWSGGIDAKFTTLQSLTASNSSSINQLNLITASFNTWTGSTYSTFSQSVDYRLDSVEYTVTVLDPGNIGNALLGLNAFTASSQIKFNNIEAATGSYETKGRGIVSGSSQIVPLLPTGVVSGSSQITLILPSGTVSGSSQVIGILSSLNSFSASNGNTSLNTFTASNDNISLNSYTSSLKGAITVSGTDVSIAGGLTVLGTTTIIDSTTVNIKDNIIQLNGAGAANAGIVVRDATGTLTSGSLLWDTTNDYWVAGPLGAELKLLRTGGDNVISSSTQIPSLLPTGVVSGSSQITYSGISSIPAGIVSGAAQIPPLLPSGVISGSSQISGITNSQLVNTSISIAGVATALGSAVSADQIRTAIGTVVTGSSQITLSSTTGGGTTSNVQFGSLGIGTTSSGASGEIRATGDITAFYSSDIRLKENIQPIQNALEKVESISGNTYDWKEGYEEIHSHKGNDVGVIAQEIEEILPQIVTNRDNGYKAVQYEKMIPLLIEAIKELSAKVDRLENK